MPAVNLVKLTGQVPHWPIRTIWTYSARSLEKIKKLIDTSKNTQLEKLIILKIAWLIQQALNKQLSFIGIELLETA
jgi:hypothetical protein